jgi:hypothetical protein
MPPPFTRIKILITALLSAALLSFTNVRAQTKDSTLFFRSALSVTQNGFSFIPSFSLGKPAVIFEPSVGNKRLSFEPQFRFAMEGKPWSFIFIYRYKIIDRNKFQLTVGGHIPAIVFGNDSIVANGVRKDFIIARRFIAGELMPNYQLTKNTNIGLMYLQGHGFQKDATQNTWFLGLRSSISNIQLSERFFARFAPMVFFLKTDADAGYYFTYTFTLAAKKFPISIQHILNRAIQSEIQAKKFDWNISLVYSFDKNYIRK